MTFKVLIIDDDDNSVMGARITLEYLGIEFFIESHDNPKNVFQRVKEGGYSLVLVDINLEDGSANKDSGLERHAVSASVANTGAFVAIWSGDNRIDSVYRAKELKLDGYIIKGDGGFRDEFGPLLTAIKKVLKGEPPGFPDDSELDTSVPFRSRLL